MNCKKDSMMTGQCEVIEPFSCDVQKRDVWVEVSRLCSGLGVQCLQRWIQPTRERVRHFRAQRRTSFALPKRSRTVVMLSCALLILAVGTGARRISEIISKVKLCSPCSDTSEQCSLRTEDTHRISPSPHNYWDDAHPRHQHSYTEQLQQTRYVPGTCSACPVGSCNECTAKMVAVSSPQM